MARVLEPEEKQALSQYGPFMNKCNWAVRDYAAFWATHTGTGLTPGAQLLKWAKDRILGVNIVLRGITDLEIPIKFAELSKGMSLEFPAVPVDGIITNEHMDSCIDVLLAAQKFEELASLYNDLKGEDINMSAGGN